MAGYLVFGIICSLFISGVCHADTWAKTYGGESSESISDIRQTSDGGYIIAGQTGSFGASIYDAWLLKLNKNGNVQWQKSYSNSSVDDLRSIQETADGGYIAAGQTWFVKGGDVNAWVLKLDAQGNIIWQKIYDGLSAYCIQQTADGGYIVVGEISGDGWVLKLDSAGNVEWQKSLGSSGSDSFLAVQQTHDAGFILLGSSNSFQGGQWVTWVVKLDGVGNTLWQKTYGTFYTNPYSISAAADGGYVVAGMVTLPETVAPNAADFWIVKLTSDGSVEWQRIYNFAEYDRIYRVRPANGGGYIAVGEVFFSGQSTSNIWVAELDSAGTIRWQQSYGGSSYEWANSIQQTVDGGFIVGGITWTFGFGPAGGDVLVMKLDTSGNIPDCSLVMPANAAEIPSAIVVSDTTVNSLDTSSEAYVTAAEPMDTSAKPNGVCK